MRQVGSCFGPLGLFFAFFGTAIAGKNSLPDSVRALGSTDSFERVAAVNAIYASTGTAIPFLIEGLQDQSPKVRQQSLKLLMELDVNAASEAVLQLSMDEPDLLIRTMAIKALGCIRHPRAQGLLARIARDQSLDSFLRVAAIRGQSRHAPQSTENIWRGFLSDPNVLVRSISAEELAKRGDSRGKAVASEILKLNPANADGYSAQHHAMEALYFLVPRSSDSATDILNKLDVIIDGKGFNSEEAAILALHLRIQQVPVPDRLPLLRSALGDSQRFKRVWAARELADSKDPGAETLLLKFASREGEGGQIEAARVLKMKASRTSPQGCE